MVNNVSATNEAPMMDHDYDGIHELDNPAPMWIMLILYLSIAFSLFYAFYNFMPGLRGDQWTRYEASVAAFEAKQNDMKENNAGAVAAISLDQIKEQGSKLFLEKGCIACHGMNGEGNAIGPNLTDKNWINGCSEAEIIKIITDGKPEKGMTPYKAMMSADQIKILAQYISKVLVGSNPANPKAAQGELCE